MRFGELSVETTKEIVESVVNCKNYCDLDNLLIGSRSLDCSRVCPYAIRIKETKEAKDIECFVSREYALT